VGALTDRDFRFQCRVWFLGSSPSVCPGCSRGCNIEVHYNTRFDPRYHDKRVQRLKPRHNAEVNGYWMCDEGRYAYHALDAPGRLKEPLVRAADGLQPVSWGEALDRAAAAIRIALERRGADALAVLASPQSTNEELFRLRQIFRDELGVRRTEHRVPRLAPVYADDFLVTADKHPNSRGAETLGWSGAGAAELLRDCVEGRVACLYVLHHDLTLGFDPELVARALGCVEIVLFQGSWDNPTARHAHVVLPDAAYAEKAGTFTNVQGRVQQIFPALPPLGEALPGLEILARLAERLGLPPRASDAEQTFSEVAAAVTGFSGMSYGTVGTQGQPLAGAPQER
jgi:NADH-quinone oxidoreductase subunit G